MNKYSVDYINFGEILMSYTIDSLNQLFRSAKETKEGRISLMARGGINLLATLRQSI